MAKRKDCDGRRPFGDQPAKPTEADMAVDLERLGRDIEKACSGHGYSFDSVRCRLEYAEWQHEEFVSDENWAIQQRLQGAEAHCRALEKRLEKLGNRLNLYLDTWTDLDENMIGKAEADLLHRIATGED